MTIKKLTLTWVVLTFFIVAETLFGGPTLIQDNRVTNLDSTPVLGRGYSVATNTYQSTCLKDIQLTEPSYDFTYSFQEIDDFLSEINNSDSQFMKIANTTFKNSLTRDTEDTKTTTQGTNQESTATFEETKQIIVNVTIDSYYASVDESKTRLSDTAAKLIENNDLPGFFSSCGSYYIRSIRRSALFTSNFKFKSVTTLEDSKFINQLESELKGFRKKVISKKGESDQTEKTTEDTKDTTTDTTSFSSAAVNRNLTITASAFGLGKNEKATLISYDIETFKAAIKDAFISMQNPRTGKVTSIEVVPWVENTEFQTLMKLEEDVAGYKASAQGGPPQPQEGRKLLMYEKKHNLNQNAEFFAELNRADRAMMNIYYKAKICKKHIDTNWKQVKGGIRVFKDVYAKRYVMNNRYTNAGVELAQLDAALTSEKINGLLQAHRQYMYGGGDWGDGAAACMSQLMELGIFRVNYRDIEPCQKLEENLMQIEEDIIENHCMPVLFKSSFVPSDTSASQ
ncbi:hypothetical protein KJ966_02065 [bacterium]|nr:hypothetical protein [bacterium]